MLPGIFESLIAMLMESECKKQSIILQRSLNHFDLVAVQEVNENLYGLNRVLKVLGTAWEVIYSDTTEGNSGNKERLAFFI